MDIGFVKKSVQLRLTWMISLYGSHKRKCLKKLHFKDAVYGIGISLFPYQRKLLKASPNSISVNSSLKLSLTLFLIFKRFLITYTVLDIFRQVFLGGWTRVIIKISTHPCCQETLTDFHGEEAFFFLNSKWPTKKVRFSTTPILSMFVQKFQRLVLGLVG